MSFPYNTLIFSGGGVRGIAFIGVLCYLEEMNWRQHIKTYIGSSVGAMIAGLAAVGYDAKELFTIISNLDITKLRNIDVFQLPDKFGIDSGQEILDVLTEHIYNKTKKSQITFQQLFELTGNELIVTGTNVNTHDIVYFSKDTTPDLPIVLGIRVSISIPFYYTSPCYQDSYYVDGAIMDNFPIAAAKDKRKVLGAKLINPNVQKGAWKPIQDIETFITNVIHCLIYEIEHLRNQIHLENWKDNVIFINTGNISSLDFDITKDQKKQLFIKGFQEAKRLLIKRIKIKTD